MTGNLYGYVTYRPEALGVIHTELGQPNPPPPLWFRVVCRVLAALRVLR